MNATEIFTTQNKEFSKMEEQWRAVFIEKCTYGSERGLCKPTAVMQQGGIFLLYLYIYSGEDLPEVEVEKISAKKMKCTPLRRP